MANACARRRASFSTVSGWSSGSLSSLLPKINMFKMTKRRLNRTNADNYVVREEDGLFVASPAGDFSRFSFFTLLLRFCSDLSRAFAIL